MHDDLNETPQSDTNTQQESQDFTEMTLFEVFQAGLSAPKAVLLSLWDVFNAEQPAPLLTVRPNRATADTLLDRMKDIISDPQVMRIAFYGLAFVIALIGSFMIGGAPLARRGESIELARGAPYLLVGAFFWLVAELIGHSHDLRDGFNAKPSRIVLVAVRVIPILFVAIGVYLFWQSATLPHDILLSALFPATVFVILGVGVWLLTDAVRVLYRWMWHHQPARIPMILQDYFPIIAHDETLHDDELIEPWYMRLSLVRLVLAVVAMILTVMTWFGSANNQLPLPSFLLWMLSIGTWAWVFAPADWNLIAYLQKKGAGIRQIDWRAHWWAIVVLCLIIVIGGFFRGYQLEANPREMTDDHVEKILDSGLIRDGMRPIFLANNGGREPFQMYMIALASHLPGLGINHYTIKFVAVFESILTLPILFWLGYELLSGETRRRRILFGLLLAGLVAVSYWHVAITRQGLRIVLTPLVASLLLIYLMRAIRRNHRADFIKAGLVLGFGLYMYQALRMLPIVVVVAVGLSMYFSAQNWRERIRYALNLLVLTWITFIIFIPMLHYSVEQPDIFWRRTAGRLLGDDLVEETRPDGTIVTRDATVEERITAFQENIPTLVSNVRNVLLMFNWKGDVATISGIPNRPVFDPVSGTLLIVGCGAWIVLMIRRRDLVFAIVPIFAVIMLLPSALSIALPVENPSNTRTSGALPAIYLLATLPLALFVDYAIQTFQNRRIQIMMVGISIIIVVSSLNINRYDYFDIYPSIYAESFHPYTEAGNYLRGFVLTGGSYGNAFMIGYPYWWSHRAIGLAGGLEERWVNGIERRTDIPPFLQASAQNTGRFRFDPDRDLIFFYSPNDSDTSLYLQELFPNGYAQEQVTYQVNDNYMVFRVPALGQSEFLTWLQMHLQ